MARLVSENSHNAKRTWSKLSVAQVSGSVRFFTIAALSSARYGRNTGFISTSRQKPSAGSRQRPSGTRRAMPFLPPTTTNERRPSSQRCNCSTPSVISSSGTAAAAARLVCGGYWNRLQIRVVRVWNPAGIAKMAGVPNIVSACMNATKPPASIAGSTNGKVTRSMVSHVRPPRMAEASSRSAGTRSSALASRVNTSGKA